MVLDDLEKIHKRHVPRKSEYSEALNRANFVAQHVHLVLERYEHDRAFLEP